MRSRENSWEDGLTISRAEADRSPRDPNNQRGGWRYRESPRCESMDLSQRQWDAPQSPSRLGNVDRRTVHLAAHGRVQSIDNSKDKRPPPDDCCKGVMGPIRGAISVVFFVLFMLWYSEHLARKHMEAVGEEVLAHDHLEDQLRTYSRQELQERLEQLAATEAAEEEQVPEPPSPPPPPPPSIVEPPHPRDFPNAPPRQPQGRVIVKPEPKYAEAEAERLVRADAKKMRKIRSATAAGEWSRLSWNQRLERMESLPPDDDAPTPAARPAQLSDLDLPVRRIPAAPADSPIPAPYILPDSEALPIPAPYVVPDALALEPAEQATAYVTPQQPIQSPSAADEPQPEAMLAHALPPLPDLPAELDAVPHELPELPEIPDDVTDDELPSLPELPCVSWRQTGGCISQGPREPEADRACDVVVQEQWSGYCECQWGNHMAVGNSCGHSVFTCDQACGGGIDWRPSAKPKSLPPAGKASLLAQLEVPVSDLTAADCPAESISFYREVPIVYTWVDGSDGDYQWLRKNYGGVTGGPDDRDSSELRFSWRSLEKYLPWWEGPLFLVSPGAQTPSWVDVENDRIHIVSQDDIYPKAKKGTASPLPTFNINSIEQWLYMIPGLSDAARIIVHMNDDYLFVGPVTPQDLFGPTCEGVRVLADERVIDNIVPETYQRQVANERASPRGKVWALSVANSYLALSEHYDPDISVQPFLKHGPYVYVRDVLYDITTKLFRSETVATSTHKFRDPEDVVTPFLHSGIIRAVDAESRVHPVYRVEVTVGPQSEMAKFLSLSLHGVPPAPLMDPNPRSRADTWYERLLHNSGDFKCVAIHDAMPGAANQTVISMLHQFYSRSLPVRSSFEREDRPFRTQGM